MQTKNEYLIPININRATKISEKDIAHVGDLQFAMDYDAPEGTAVLAARNGKVISIKQNSTIGGDDKKFENDGNYIEILHDNDEISEYEHLKYKSVKIKVGDIVETGQPIAEVGNTGWSECPHLHFMVYPKDKINKTLKIKFT
jgi:murein DD-endopeptidase MepM/ murein hydrolase activator NlpD